MSHSLPGKARRTRGPTLNDIFFDNIATFDRAPLLIARCNGKPVEFTSRQFAHAVYCLGEWLLAAGIRPGDRVAVLSENRPEWHIADFAILLSGMTSVPLYTSFSGEQLASLVRHSGATALIVSTPELRAKMLSRGPLPGLRVIVTIDEEEFRRIIAPGNPCDEAAIRRTALAIEPDRLATIVYTSGTTGTPKGVMLTHDNIVSNLVECIRRLDCTSAPRALSVLPLAHVFERLLCYGYFRMGIPIAYGDPHDLAELLPVHRPVVMGCVPRVLEKIRENVLAEINRLPARRQVVARWLLRVGHDHIGDGTLRRKPKLYSRLCYPLASSLLYRKMRRKLGGELRFLVCGGAPLQPLVEEFFLAAGLRVIQGYGLTETSPVVSLTPLDAAKPGTVGKPLDNVDVRFEPDGELLIRGPNVTQGYYHHAEGTALPLKEGWFRTGDVGRLDEDGYLVITGRKKELIVTSGGKNVAPVPIEEQLSASSLIARAFVVGDGRKFIGALIVPDRVRLSEICRRAGIEGRELSDLASHAAVREEYIAEIDRVQKGCSAVERVKNFAFLDESALADPDVITPTQKIRRAALEVKYSVEIDSIYSSLAVETTARAGSVS